MASLKGKVIAVTGAASGIGLATATRLASLGARVSISDNNERLLASLASELSKKYGETNVFPSVVDVTDRKVVEAWIAETTKNLGPLDGAANVAGVLGRQGNAVSIPEIEEDEWDFVMGVNFGGVRNSMAAEIPALLEGGRTGGAIVNVSSVAGKMGLALNGAYTASKHAVVGLTKTAAKELGAKGVRVNAVCP
ncbi:short-chain dehydrogenase [Colletotrichum karsti]|uniref:Short-chain dehydrogenase n=1 Tax=Colletotrichum karsti TaxID=1095194 RepID=A0A9P6LF29_9PEZI|nr:short-chain dehydrogenase [Colletotrichum karsti]KAF9869882.1 short-chain dehydrogenase [Colletotrichum karsti]